MLDYLAWYQVELYSRLKGKIDSERLPIILGETASHIQEAASTISQTDHLSEEESIKSAIKSFGSPEEIADGFLHPLRARVWLPVVCVSAATLSVCTALLMIWLDQYFDNFGDTLQNQIAGLTGLAAAIMLYFACRAYGRSCRLILTGVSAATAVCLVFVLSFWIIGDSGSGDGISRFNQAADLAGACTALVELNRQKQLQETLAPIFQKAKTAADLTPPMQNIWLARTTYGLRSLPDVSFSHGRAEDAHFVVPMSPGTMKRGDAYTFGTVATFDEAKAEWANFASYDLKMNALVTSLSAMIEEGRHPKLVYWNPNVFGNGVAAVLMCWPLLVVIDGLAIWSRKRRVRPNAIFA